MPNARKRGLTRENWMKERKNEWMDEWMGEWMDGWMDEWMEWVELKMY